MFQLGSYFVGFLGDSLIDLARSRAATPAHRDSFSVAMNGVPGEANP